MPKIEGEIVHNSSMRLKGSKQIWMCYSSTDCYLENGADRVFPSHEPSEFLETREINFSNC